MGIFSKTKCERCGKKVSGKSEEKAVCEECEEELALLVKACEENSRVCPIDGTTMSKSIAHMIVVDRCPKCQGVWLDGGELEKVYSSASESALNEITRDLWIPFG